MEDGCGGGGGWMDDDYDDTVIQLSTTPWKSAMSEAARKINHSNLHCCKLTFSILCSLRAYLKVKFKCIILRYINIYLFPVALRYVISFPLFEIFIFIFILSFALFICMPVFFE